MKHTGGEYHNLHPGLGAKGYDVVAYLDDGAAVPGSERHSLEHGGDAPGFIGKAGRNWPALNR